MEIADKAIEVPAVQSRAWLNVFGHGLDFNLISSELNLTPYDTHRAGDLDRAKKPLPQDLWSVASPLPRSEPLNAHVQWLVDRLFPHYGFLLSLKRNAEVRSFCGLIIEGDRAAFRLSPKTLGLFVGLAIPMEISLIFSGIAQPIKDFSDLDSSQAKPEMKQPTIETYQTECEVTFQISGAGLDLEGVSRTLGLKPSEAHRSVDRASLGQADWGDLWSFALPLPPNVELEAQLEWVGTRLLPHSDFLRSLKGTHELLIRCNFRTESETGGLSAAPASLRICTDLDIPLEFNTSLM